MLHPDREGRKSILVDETKLPKWGNAVDDYLAAFENARKAVTK